jgi:hypothetical protein
VCGHRYVQHVRESTESDAFAVEMMRVDVSRCNWRRRHASHVKEVEFLLAGSWTLPTPGVCHGRGQECQQAWHSPQ